MKFMRYAAVGLAAALVLTACSSDKEEPTPTNTGAPEPGTIKLWLAGGDTPNDLREWLKTRFAEENPGSTLVIEEQDWNGLVPKLTTALASEEQTPDVVEVGNTQAPLFTNAGAFLDITDVYNEVGGSKLLAGFVAAGSVGDKVLAVPYYSGARAVFYNKQAFADAGVQVPKTLAEFNAAAKKLKAEGKGGLWLPGQDWYNGIAWIFTNGGDLAVPDGNGWKATLSEEGAQKGLAEVADLFANGTIAPKDADSADPWIPFNRGDVAMFSAPTWARWSIDLPECNEGVDKDDKSEEADAKRVAQQECNESKTGIFALPGLTPEKPAVVFAGGSNMGISAKSKHPELSKNLLKLIYSEEFQNLLGKNGLIPGNTEYRGSVGDDVYAQAATVAALDAKLTPAAANWADVEGDRIMEDFFQKIAQGTDIKTAAEEADGLINAKLNQ